METEETQQDLRTEVGDEEACLLKPKNVLVGGVKIEQLGEKKAKKLSCICKHPDKEEPINISEVKLEMKGALKTMGLWVNKDSKGYLRKGSALGNFLNFFDAKNASQLIGKTLPTTTDESGYLCFKAY